MKRTVAIACLSLGVLAAVGAATGILPVGRTTLAAPLPTLVAVPIAGHAPIWVQPYEVTVAEWNLCNASGGCTQHLIAPGGRDPDVTPATTLSQPDVAEYVAWISARTGHAFRLPTVAEWSILAAGVLPEAPAPIFTDPNLAWASAYLLDEAAPRTLMPRGSFSISADGVADLDGSVWEWTQDCAVPALADRCPAYTVAGEHMAVVPFLERDPARGGCAVGAPPAHLGMRLVSDIAPRG